MMVGVPKNLVDRQPDRDWGSKDSWPLSKKDFQISQINTQKTSLVCTILGLTTIIFTLTNGKASIKSSKD